jgi:hypothetical protein
MRAIVSWECAHLPQISLSHRFAGHTLVEVDARLSRR